MPPVKDDLDDDPGPDLPAPLTLRLLAGSEVLFTSEKHWLHPLFDLEAFFGESGQDPAATLLVDKVTGRAAALLIARLGIPELHTQVLSRRALPVLAAHRIHVRCREVVDQLPCATEDLLAGIGDPEAAWALLQERRARSLAL